MKTESNLIKILAEANKSLDAYIYEGNAPAREKEARRKSKIVNAKSFEIEKYYQPESWFENRGKLNYHGNFEEFEVSRLSDAAIIFDSYRKIGHEIGLRKLVVRAENEVVYKLNFNYKIN